MQAKLTEKDIKDLKYRCRVAYFLFGIFFLISIPIALGSHNILGISEAGEELSMEKAMLMVSGLFVFTVAMIFMMNRKYLKDIKNGFKIAHKKTIQRRIKKRDFEAGSGKHRGRMTEFARYDLIIDNTIYLIDEELYDKCNDGDEVLFFYAPESKYLLSIEKK